MKIDAFTIIDYKNKEAACYNFSKGTNLLVSRGNTKGKSSLLKSIYFTLGFDIKQFPSNWNTEDMLFQIEITISDSKHTIIRQNDIYKVDSVEGPLNSREYSDWLHEQLEINMMLPNVRTQKLFKAYSSAIILPFYIDQDDSWDGVLYKQVSDTLGQYGNIPKSIFEYLFSISDIDIQELQNKLNQQNKILKEAELTIVSLTKVVSEYKNDISNVGMASIDKEDLKKEIDFYLKMLNEFSVSAMKYKVKLIDRKELLDLQQQDLTELNQLLKLNKKRSVSIKSTCNYCNSNLTVEQSLTRLNLTNNEFEMELLKSERVQSIDKLNQEIKGILLEQKDLELKIAEINSHVRKSKELLTIDEYVNSRAKSVALNEMQELINKEIILKESISLIIKDLRAKLNAIKSQKEELIEKITVDFRSILFDLKTMLPEVDLNELSFLTFKKVKGSGMDKNKKYLAYYLVYLTLIKKYGHYKLPFCMDSFIKNEISGDTAKEMFETIEKYLLNDSNQTFFSIIEENLSHLRNVKEYNIIPIGGKLLSNSDYDKLSSRIIKFE